jgi:hypothetical protein
LIFITTEKICAQIWKSLLKKLRHKLIRILLYSINNQKKSK